jgi:hypothetical protein
VGGCTAGGGVAGVSSLRQPVKASAKANSAIAKTVMKILFMLLVPPIFY